MWNHEDMGRSPTKKETREKENDECMGGMRNPHIAVSRLPALRDAGARMSRVLDDVLRNSPEVLSAVESLGAEMDAEQAAHPAAVMQAAGATAAGKLAKLLQCPQGAEVLGPTGWRWKLLQAMVDSGKDPERDVPLWLAGQTPLGIVEAIPARGIFPRAEPSQAQLESAEYLAARVGPGSVEKNYQSFEDHEAESEAELQRLCHEGHVEVIGNWEAVKARWPSALATRVATLVKQKDDGSTKVRFIVDMLRSGVNSLSSVGERIVLPRGSDLVKSALDLWQECQGCEGVGFLVIDISDAFLNLHVSEAERGYLIIRDQRGVYLAYRGVPFGLAPAPLLWGRTAALLGRLAQAIHHPREHRCQIYVDDPVLVVKGTAGVRQWLLAKTLLLWASLGARLAYRKAEQGDQVAWIGAQYRVLHRGVQISVTSARIGRLLVKIEHMMSGQGMVSGLRSLVGELSWVAGLIPRVRPWVTMLWAAVHAMLRQAQAVKQGSSSARARPDGLVYKKAIQRPMDLIVLFLRGEHGGLQRIRWLADRFAVPALCVRTDASTTGMGGILLTPEGAPLRFWAGPITEVDCRALQIQAGMPDFMTVYELLAIILSLVIWKPYLARKRLAVGLEADSQAALLVQAKLASKSPPANELAAELALLLEQLQIEVLLGRHWRNVVNIEADALSRLGEGKEIPLSLRSLPRDPVPCRSKVFQFIKLVSPLPRRPQCSVRCTLLTVLCSALADCSPFALAAI